MVKKDTIYTDNLNRLSYRQIYFVRQVFFTYQFLHLLFEILAYNSLMNLLVDKHAGKVSVIVLTNNFLESHQYGIKKK